MKKNLKNDTGIFALKSKFFLYRAISYFSFLLLPIWLQKREGVASSILIILMLFYILFMAGQWFHLGKEIDHRLKIYFRVNSSIDRVVYRLFLGMIFILIYYNILSLFPLKWANSLFWFTWAVSGIFYSWPTRGKIIRESVLGHFTEFKYLDAFEKTLVGLIILMFIVSMPELNLLATPEALKLYFDPKEYLSPQIWNFIKINYIPFINYPFLTKLAWSMHFYFVQMGLFLALFYAFLRFFISRRLSLLGVFAVLSTWSFSKLLIQNMGICFFSIYSLIWIWSLLWVTKSGTYRSGLFMGLMGYFGVLIYRPFIIIYFIQLMILNFYTLQDKTMWFKKQLLKYNLLGIFLSFLTLLIGAETNDFFEIERPKILENISTLISRKAFYSLSFFGVILILFKLFSYKKLNFFKLKEEYTKIFIISLLVFFLFSIFFRSFLIEDFSLIWPIVFCSLMPLEILFQTTHRWRSKRNMIYLIYIIICLLDSHFEGRIKIFLRFLEL